MGVAVLVATAAASATAWPSRSNVAAQPANAPTGDLAWLAVFAVVQAIAFALYIVAVFVVRRRPPRLGATLVLAGLIQVAPLAAPLMLSTDAWGYWSFARVSTENGGNPYVDPQSRFPADTSFAFTNPQWRENTTPYGPAFTLPSEWVAEIVGPDAQTAAWAYKALAAAAMVALVLLVSRIAVAGAFAAAFLGWNPVFAMHFAGSGHNEVLMVASLVAALGLARAGRARLAGATWAIATFIKWTALVILPLQVAADRALGRRSLLPAIILAAGALAVLATIVYGPAWVGHPLSATGDATANLSLSVWPRLPGAIPAELRLLVPAVAFIVVYAWLLHVAWRGRARRGLAMIAFLIASPYLWTWYLIAPAALSAIDDDGLAMSLTLGVTAYAGLLYLGDVGSVFRVFVPVTMG